MDPIARINAYRGGNGRSMSMVACMPEAAPLLEQFVRPSSTLALSRPATALPQSGAATPPSSTSGLVTPAQPRDAAEEERANLEAAVALLDMKRTM
jgi:hypothetical protein